MADRSRKWLLTFNDPISKGFTHDCIKRKIAEYEKVVYWCMSDETGLESNLFHTHLYIVFENPISWKSIAKHFPNVHRDMVIQGTSQQNRDYVFKEGKWLSDPKADTNHRDSHEEFGELPNERPGKRTDLDELYSMIKDGYSTYEILEHNPKYLMQVDRIDRVRQLVHEQQFKDVWRNIDVTYIWGIPGIGKTRYVMDKYGYSNVYCVTDYDHPFDGYKGQDVILFDEFRSSIELSVMLRILDGYPVELPARYNNKVACFTKVYFCTNIDIRCQYPNKQREEPLSWCAFLRRINRIKVHEDEYSTVVMRTQEYMENMMAYFDNPFMNPSPEEYCEQIALDIESELAKADKERKEYERKCRDVYMSELNNWGMSP